MKEKQGMRNVKLVIVPKYQTTEAYAWNDKVIVILCIRWKWDDSFKFRSHYYLRKNWIGGWSFQNLELARKV
jgi:hypothetical protein